MDSNKDGLLSKLELLNATADRLEIVCQDPHLKTRLKSNDSYYGKDYFGEFETIKTINEDKQLGQYPLFDLYDRNLNGKITQEVLYKCYAAPPGSWKIYSELPTKVSNENVLDFVTNNLEKICIDPRPTVATL